MSKSFYLMLFVSGVLVSCQSASKQVENVSDKIENVGDQIATVGDKIGDVQDLVKDKIASFSLDKLNKSMLITSLNGKDVPAGDNQPYIELNIKEFKLSGSTGCNTIMGGVVLDKENGLSVKFDNVATTKMACPPEQAQFEKNLLLALSSVRGINPLGDGSYEFKDSNGVVLFVGKMAD
ncbi:MAG: META domain-containing protein [Bacteroidales bacterium]